ncbi:hypothetical protein GA8_01465 [Geobacillus sp. A8]|nr:hypothetical protein GA8_01465 [Geobacillus sp. A8]
MPAVLTASLCDTLLIFLAVLGVSLVWLGSAWLKTAVMGAGILFCCIWAGVHGRASLQQAKAKRRNGFRPANKSLLPP